jgi:tetratricopeptide (TPR) repeat protein
MKPLAFSLFLALLLILGAGCSSKKIPQEPQYEAAGTLLETIKDFQRLAREDLYRYSIPKDVTGTNIMKATLVRLDDYEDVYPHRFADLVNFSKAMAYERLRDYEQAVNHYRKVANSNGRLGEQAENNILVLEAFKEILREPLPTQDPFEYIKALDHKVVAWNELTVQYNGTPYEFLARVEEEKIDRAKVAFADINRHRLKDGNQLVILGYSQLITKHRQSKNLYWYLLDFGDYYIKLAKEYTAQNDPEGLYFDPDTFDHLTKSALKFYTEVSQQDGITEKLEAKGKIQSLQALMQKIRSLNR